MTLEEFAIEFHAQLPAILAEEANWLADELKRRTPSNLQRTRTGIYVQLRGRQATVGIRFSKYYEGNTLTVRRLQQQWQTLKPLVRQRIISKINDFLKRV